MASAVFGSIRPYQRAWLGRDVAAGVALAALAIPEVMGYTKIAGMPVITGLYTILLPMVAFAIFGSSRYLVVGADSATAAIMYAGLAGIGIAGLQPYSDKWVALASMSAVITALLLLLARLARLGFLADFISRTVLVGFLTGVGIQVAMGQLAAMLGVAEPKVSTSLASGALTKFWKTLGELGQTSVTTLCVAVGVIVTLLVFSRWIKAIPGGLVAVVGAIAVSAIFDLTAHGVATLGAVPSGFPHIGFPPGVSWSQMVSLGAVSLSMLIVILAQSAATSRAYAVKHDDRFVENDDLTGLGVANLTAGLTGTFVVNGSPTKTEMVDEAGSHTQVAQLTCAAVVAFVLLFLTKPLQYLPNAALAAVVFVIGVKLVDVRQMREIWRLRKDEFSVAAVTAVVVVCVGVEQGIILAILLSVVLHVRRHYSPHNLVLTYDRSGVLHPLPPRPGTESEPGLVIYRPAVGLFYANAERFVLEARGLIETADPPRWFVIHAGAVDDVDYTAGKVLVETARQLRARGIVMGISNANATLRRELESFGVIDIIGREHLFDTVQAARDAFHAAPLTR